MITMATALTSVRERLDEPSERRWSQEMLRRWINEGTREIARRTEALFDTLDIPVLTPVAEYTVPANVLRIHNVEYLPTGQSTRINLIGRSRESLQLGSFQDLNVSNPYIYTAWGFPPTLKLRVFPSPAYNGNLHLYVSRLPLIIPVTGGTTDTTNLDFPEGWIEIVYDYVEMRALRRDKDTRWQESQSLYETNVQQMANAASTYLRDSGEIVGERPGFMNDYWFLDS